MIDTFINILALLVMLTVGTDASIPVFFYGLLMVALYTILILWLIGFLLILPACIRAILTLK